MAELHPNIEKFHLKLRLQRWMLMETKQELLSILLMGAGGNTGQEMELVCGGTRPPTVDHNEREDLGRFSAQCSSA